MRTTVDINDALVERLRALMAARKMTMRSLIEEGLRKLLDEAAQAHAEFTLRDASVGEGGMQDAVDDLSWDTMSRFLYPTR